MKERTIDIFLMKSFKVNGIEVRIIDILFALVIFALAVIARVWLAPIETQDYVTFLSEWMKQIREVGWLKSWGVEISNYAPSYMYLMSLVSLITKDTLIGLKWLSYVFDFVLAFVVFLIALHETGSVKKSMLGFTMALFSPAVLIDSGIYCQCDMIYSTFILLGLYFFCKDQSRSCMICMGVSFAFKLQAVFILPFLVIMWLKKKTVKLYDFLWFPAVYIVSIIPSALCGRNFWELLTFYTKQADYYPWGTLNYPNIYVFFDETMWSMHFTDEICAVGLIVTMILLGALAYYLYLNKINMDSELTFSIALFSVFTVVYFLPHMHDRYGFLVDILAIVVACINPKKIVVAGVTAIVSIMTLMTFIYGYAVINYAQVTYITTALWLYLAYDLFIQCRKKAIPLEQQ